MKIAERQCPSCVSACDSVEFQNELSFASLSAEAYRDFDTTLQTTIGEKYRASLSLMQRMTKFSMHKLMDEISTINDTLRFLQEMAAFDFFNYKTSIFSRVEAAANDFIKRVDKDLDAFYDTLRIQKNEYDKHLRPVLDSHMVLLEESQQAMIHGIILWQNPPNDISNAWHYHVEPMFRHFERAIITLHEYLQLMKSLNNSVREDQWARHLSSMAVSADDLPRYLTYPRDKRESCLQNFRSFSKLEHMVTQVSDSLHEFIHLVSTSSESPLPFAAFPPIDYRSSLNFSTILSIYDQINHTITPLRTNVSSHIEQIRHCLQHYEEEISAMLERNSLRSIPRIPFVDESAVYQLDHIQVLNSELDILSLNFTNNDLTVYGLAEEFSKFTQRVNDAVGILLFSISNRLVQPVDSSLGKIANAVIKYYTQAIDDISTLEHFITSDVGRYEEKIINAFVWEEPDPDLVGRNLIWSRKERKAIKTMFRHGLQVFWRSIGKIHTLGPFT